LRTTTTGAGPPAPDVEELTSLDGALFAFPVVGVRSTRGSSAEGSRTPEASPSPQGARLWWEALRDQSRHRIPECQGGRSRRAYTLLRLGAVTGGVNAAPGILVLKDVNFRLTGTAADALNQTFNTDLFSGGLLIGQATVIATTRG
jgi:hypothetical protein